MRSKILVAVVLFLLSLVNTGYTMERFEIISTHQLQQMLKERSEGKLDFVLVNSLDVLIYENLSIPGSVNIPWSRVSELADRLGNDKDKLIVTYCMGYR